MTETEFEKREYIFEEATQTILKHYPFVKHLEFLREQYEKRRKIETPDECYELLNNCQPIQEAFGIEDCRTQVIKVYEKPFFGLALRIIFFVEPIPERKNPRPVSWARTYAFFVNDMGIMMQRMD
jgi:hypothetical protein